MPLPRTKQGLADYILRQLGAPVVNVEISDVQLEDAIDDAVQMFQEYHYDGAERAYRVLKLDTQMINENQRRHQNLTAKKFNSDSEYKVGARVLYQLDSDKGELIYIKTDSEYGQKVVYDSEGDSDGTIVNITTDSDGSFRTNFTEESLYLRDSYVLTDGGQVGIRVPENIISISRVHKVDSFSSTGMYNYEYQYFLNNFDAFYGNAAGYGLTGYYIQKQYVEYIDFMLNTSPAIRYSKAKNRLYLDIDWKRPKKNNYFLIECYEVTDPDIFGDVYKNIWIKKYSTALAKKQVGTNLKKYENTELPGGVQLNGQAMYDEAMEDIKELEEEVKENLQLGLDSIVVG